MRVITRVQKEGICKVFDDFRHAVLIQSKGEKHEKLAAAQEKLAHDLHKLESEYRLTLHRIYREDRAGR